MGAAPRKMPVAVAHENPGGYGQGKHENMIEWEVFDPVIFNFCRIILACWILKTLLWVTKVVCKGSKQAFFGVQN